jgi:hypothetical protein
LWLNHTNIFLNYIHNNIGLYSKGDIIMENLLNQRYGKLVVIGNTFKLPNKNGRDISYVECKCDCGNIIIANKDSLKRGVKKSCGCLKLNVYNEMSISRMNNLLGMRFGKLQVIKYIGSNKTKSGKSNGSEWLCLCDCGNTRIIQGRYLTSSGVVSCGCTRVRH